MSGVKISRILLLSFVIASLFSNVVTVYSPLSSTNEICCTNRLMLVDVYTPHIPIIINSNEDFISQGWSGNGTESNPYVIEGLSIISSETCISISDTNVHFEIRNCLISASNLSTNNGIAFSNVMNGVIRDCFVELHYYGIYLYSSSFCSLMNNNATKNLWYGFYLSSSTSCILTNNTACENKYGFYLSSSSLCILTDNTLYGNGLVIRGDSVSNWLHTVSNNTVNKRPLGYFSSVSEAVIDGSQYGQVILANCSGFTVRNGIFVNVSVGIQLGFCTGCALTNNTATNNDYGYYLVHSVSCNLSNNTANDNDYGYYLLHSAYCIITNSTATDDNYVGFYLNASPSNRFVNNTASGSNYGFYFTVSGKCTLTNNTADNNHCGFYLSTSLSIITKNIASRNDNEGFFLYSFSSSVFANNTASGNGYGIYLNDYCHDNLFLLNQFINNIMSNAYDNGNDNSWDNGMYGNYWDDYSGDGVYNIPGAGGSVDHHPLMIGEPIPSGENTTTTTTPIMTTTTPSTTVTSPIPTTTSIVNGFGLLMGLLGNGIMIGSVIAIVIVLILAIRSRR